MVRFRPEDCAIDRATDRHGIHGGARPLLAGGVHLIGSRTGLFHDLSLRRALTDEHRLRAHLEFQHRVLQIAIPELFSAARSPVDLFRLIDWDQSDARMVEHIVLRHTRHDGTCSLLQQAAIDDGGDSAIETPVNDDGGGRGGVETTIADGEDGGSSGIGANKILIMRYLPESTIRTIENDQKCLYWRLCGAQRHFAYRKLLLKLDFIQPDSDREDVLEKLKSLTRWPGLKDYCELTSCLKSHMHFLQKHEQSKMNTALGTSEYENAALEKINSELSTTLQKHLDRYDWMLMEQYYDRVKLRRLARECATQAQTIGVILVGEALPINPEVSGLPLIKRIQGKFRSGAAAGRPLRLLALGVFAVVAAAGSLSSNVSLG